MLAVKGIYDGDGVKLLEKIQNNQPQTVIVVFSEPIEYISQNDISSKEIANLSAESGVLDFLENQQEDIYSLNDGQAVQWQ